MLYIETNVNNQTYCKMFNFLQHVQYLSLFYTFKNYIKHFKCYLVQDSGNI